MQFLACLLSLLAIASPTTNPTTAPATITVKRGTLNLSVTTTGTFEPVDAMELKLKPRAYQGEFVVVSAAAPGTTVKKDEMIVEFEQTSLRRQMASADNELLAARANYEKANSDVALGDLGDQLALKMQQEEVKNAESSLKWFDDVDGKQMLLSSELNAKYANDAVGDQEDELDQLKKMYKSEDLTNATADIVVKRAVRGLERSKVGAEMSAARAQKMKENDYEVTHTKVVNAVEQQKQALKRLEAAQAQARVLRQTGLAGARLGLEAAEEKVNNFKADADQFTVRAPQMMTIAFGQFVNGSWQNPFARGLRAGDKVPPQQPVLTAYVPGRLRLSAEIPESKVLLVANGLKATATPNAMPQLTFDGTTADPTPVAGASGSYPAIVTVNGMLDPRLEPGMKASVVIDAGKAENVLLVPTGCIKDRKATVRDKDGTEKSVDVKTGRTDGESVEIVSGLNEGDEIVKK